MPHVHFSAPPPHTVLEKVEQQIDECRVRLRRKLQELPAPIEEQKKLIK